MKLRLCVLCCLLPLACSKPESPPTTIGQVVSFSPPADADPATLPGPRTDGGAIVLAQNAQAQLVWTNPTPGPLTALAQCTRWITSCASVHAVDDCARSVPACKTAEPWNEPACCPEECFRRYVALRTSGTAAAAGISAAYLDRDDSCIPGLSALLAGTR
jgi:hypothetical protein